MNWGIIGYGEITPSFIEGLQGVSDSNLIGIASKSSFEYLTNKSPYGNVIIYNDYEKLIANVNIDIVYIALTNNLHFNIAEKVLSAGKHLLLEKPLTPTFEQSKKLIELANSKNVFLMEGMWTRFLPAYRKLIELIKNNEIGNVKLLKVDFGFKNNWPKHRRLLNPDLIGGTLLDNADYNIFLSQDIFKEFPVEIDAQATYANTGVEDACSTILKYPSGGMAQLFSSFRFQTKQEAVIYGENGHIEFEEYWHGTKVALYKKGNMETFEFPHRVNGFEYEIEAVQKAIEKGKLEHKIMFHKATLEVARIIDKLKEILRNKV